MTTREQSFACCLLFACCAAACADSSEAAIAKADEPFEAALQASPEAYARVTQLTSEGSGCPSGSIARWPNGIDPEGAAYFEIKLIDNELWARPDLPTEQSLECHIVLTMESSACLGQGVSEVVMAGTASLVDGVRARLQIRYGFLDAGSDAMYEHVIPIAGPRGFIADMTRANEDGFVITEDLRVENTIECKHVRRFAFSSRLTVVNTEPKQHSRFSLDRVGVNFRLVPPDDEEDEIDEIDEVGESARRVSMP